MDDYVQFVYIDRLLPMIIAVYQSQEFPSDDAPPKHLYMVISESAYLLLEPDEKRKNLCTLTLYASLYSLIKIERDLDTPNKLIFHWRRPDHKVGLRCVASYNRINISKSCM